MARLLSAFNPNNFDPTQGSSMLPVGKLLVVATSSEVKPTSDGNNGYLQYNLEVIDGDHKGASGAYRLNLYHSNQQTVEIANRQFSALCHVTGQMGVVEDSAQLHNIPFIVDVQKQTKGEGAEKGYTEVKRVFDANGNEPGKGGQNSAKNVAAQAGQPAQGGFSTANNVPMNQGGFGGQAQGGQPANQGGQAAGAAWGQGGQAQGGQAAAGSWGGASQGGQTSGGPAWGGGQAQGAQQGGAAWGGAGNGGAAAGGPAWGNQS